MIFIETESIELKRILNSSFEKEVVSFLNSHNGTIYIGVNDDGTIIGVNNVNKTMKDIADIITDKILPNPQEFINYSAKYIDDKIIIEVNVMKGNSLYYIKKYGRSSYGCFVRIGTSSRSMTEEQIEKEYIKSLNIAEKTIFEKRSLRQTLKFTILKTLLIGKNQYINEQSFNETYSLLNEKGEYNYYANLLDDEADVSIKGATFKGKDKTVFIKRNEFGFQCILVALQKVIDYTDSINETYVDVTTTPRKEKRMFSSEAFKEGWINAIIHTDWKQGVPPAVYVYDDRLEIVSVGGLPKGQTIEGFFNGKSVPVNEPMIRLFIKLDLMEQNGHGVPIIINKYGKEAFTIEDNFITATIPFDKSLFKYNTTQETTQETTQDKILNTMKLNSKITRKELAIIIGLTEDGIKYNLNIMKKQGIIERIGSTKSGYWKIKERK